jgi:hypothetical protein
MYHSFTYPLPPRQSGPSVPETLMVYNFILDSSIEWQALEIMCSQGCEKYVKKQRWQENPADMITELVLRDLAKSGLFEKTVDQLSNARYRYALEGVIRKMQGVVQNGKASAFFEAEATLIDFEAPISTEKNLLRKTYRIETPSADAKPEAIVAALNQGVREFSSQLRSDISEVLIKKAPKTKKEAKVSPHSPLNSPKIVLQL